MKRKLAVFLAICCGTSGWCVTPAYAFPVTWEFEGVVDILVFDNRNLFNEEQMLGSPISWQITFENTTYDSNASDANVGLYYNSISAISGVVGDMYFEKEFGSNSFAFVFNNIPILDSYYDRIVLSSPVTLADIAFTIGVTIVDFDSSMISNDSFPLDALQFSENTSAVFSIASVAHGSVLNGHILSVVPDPATLTLLAVGAFACLKRRRVSN